MAEQTNPVHWRIEKWFSDIPQNQVVQLKLFFDELGKNNKSLNLISPKTMPFADAIHFADAILASRLIMTSQNLTSLHEVGSGNGFPGLVMAILFPKTHIVCIEKDEKKVNFLNSLTTQMRLSNYEVSRQSVEAMSEKSLTTVVTRGYSTLSKTILALRKQVVPGGRVYHLKGEEWATEVAQIPTQLCSYWTPSLLCEYRLPVGEIKFGIVRTDRTTS